MAFKSKFLTKKAFSGYYSAKEVARNAEVNPATLSAEWYDLMPVVQVPPKKPIIKINEEWAYVPIEEPQQMMASAKVAWEGEQFTYFGMVFDVEKAEQIIASSPHEAHPAPKQWLESFVGTAADDEAEEVASAEGKFHINMLQVGVNKEHMQTVDITKPGIAAEVTFKANEKRGQKESKNYILIDGNHRAKKSLREGQEFKVYVLTAQESWQVMHNTSAFLLKNLVKPTGIKSPAKPRVKKQPTPTVVDEELREGDKVQVGGVTGVVDDIYQSGGKTIVSVTTDDGGYKRVEKSQVTKTAAPNSLAESLAIGHGARVKGKIDPMQVFIFKDVEKGFTASFLKKALPQTHRISLQEAKDRKLFGPVYHGTTEERRNVIDTEGFKIFEGEEGSGDIRNGYRGNEAYSTQHSGVPAPVHHLGYGVYFTTSKNNAKMFNENSVKGMKTYYLDIPDYETINFAAPHTMMNWWIKNGYDPQLAKKDRVAATKGLTESLKSKWDAVWFKGQGLRKLLDGDQICVYDPSRVYEIDPTLSKPGDIGSKVRRKSDGMKGVIMGIRNIDPEIAKQYHNGAPRWLDVKWQKGRDYNVKDVDVDFL
jgi:hypothetical protein